MSADDAGTSEPPRAALADPNGAVRVKICGISTPETLRAALEAGADDVGLVLFPPSPRHVDLHTAEALAALARGRARVVALMVDPDDALVDAVVATVAPGLIQLHGGESPERVAEIARRTGIDVMKAIKVASAIDARQALAYRDVASLILFDAKAPEGAVLPGGNGIAFDWAALDDVKDAVAWMLSGGLTPDNVATAIRLTGACRVDVSSGVETRPGVKDAGLIRRFLRAAKTANQAA